MARKSGLDIDAYNAKRDFTKTAEPRGKTARKKGDRFIVQKHEATRLHYDFRLELDGVLKSWAVPKGPSLDPDDKRLAVRTEDHPLDYADFEGTIPQGEYGGGTVMLWDQGRWIPEPGKDPSKTIEEGHLHFRLEGELMKGDWVMFRLKGKPGEKSQPWMLKKVDDDFARPGEGTLLVEDFTTSVTSDRTMAEIVAGKDQWSSRKSGRKGGRVTKKAGKAPPKYQAPQLATLVDAVPTGSDWIYEYKYDGYRLLVATGEGTATAWTRNGKDWSEKFAGIVDAASSLPAGCLIDGETVALGKNGKPDFQKLQLSLKDGKGDLAFYAFDLLIDRGEDIRKLTNLERKERLAALLSGVRAPILYGDHVVGRGEDLFNAICAEGGEGIIAKKADGRYAGRRTRDWLKVKCTRRQEFVVVGWSESDKARGFRSLLLATRDAKKLVYAGKVGTGFTMKLIDDLLNQMRPLEVDEPALDIPKAERRRAHFLKPKLVAEIAFTEFTREGTLRHPSFLGLRADKPASEVRREAPEHLKPGKASKTTLATAADTGVKITNPDRVIFPESDLTKGDLADYYAATADLFLPVGAKRPMTLVRCPQGRGKQCFFQKHDNGGLGDAVHHVPITEKDGTTEEYLWFDKAAGLLACVQMGTIEFHGWGSRVKPLEKPDRMVFDLDPDVGLGWDAVKEGATVVRDALDGLGLESFAMLSGGKGIHVIAPLTPKATWPTVKDFAERFTRAMAADRPDLFTANIRKKERKGRIFLDWLRNQRGATAVMPYSARAREGAPVAAPINWSELDSVAGANIYTIADAATLIERSRSKLLKGWCVADQPLPDA